MSASEVIADALDERFDSGLQHKDLSIVFGDDIAAVVLEALEAAGYRIVAPLDTETAE